MLNINIFEKEGIIFLTPYRDYKADIKIKCKHGHITKTSLNTAAVRVSRDNLICTECSKEIKKIGLKNRIKTILENKDYKLISDEVSYNTKVTYECSNGHINSMAISNLMNGKSCPDCKVNKQKLCKECKNAKEVDI